MSSYRQESISFGRDNIIETRAGGYPTRDSFPNRLRRP